MQTDQQAVAASDQLLQALRQYERLPEAQRASMLARMTQMAAQRRERMIALLEKDPKLAAMRVLPQAVRNRMPAQVQAQLERQVGFAGNVIALHEDDFAGRHSRTRFQLVDSKGRTFGLGIAGAGEREMLTMVGKRMKGTALQLDAHLLVLEKRDVQLLAADGTTASTGTIAATGTGSVVQGVQDTLVVLLNFSDKSVACTKDDLQSRLFGTGNGSMNDAYQQSSAGAVAFRGAVAGPFTIPYSSSGTCDLSAWASAANAAAQVAGFNPSGYMRISYALPRNTNCPFSGQATLGGQAPTPSWVMQCELTGLFSHEIGHNLSFVHASTPTSEYGDSTDPMGGSMNVQFNAANRVMSGWVGGSRVLDIAANGSYAIDALESMGSANPLVLRMPKPDTGETYYVSMRQPIGNDANLPLFARGAVSVHYATGTMPAYTTQVANLAAGQTWTDSVNGISVTHQGLTATGATVAVTRGGAACVRAAPTIGASPVSQSAAPGSKLAYGVTVRNNNSSACPSSAFNLSQALPAGFLGAFSSSSVNLAPGASASVNWNVASGTSTTDATYTLAARATESTTTNASDAQASYTVVSPPPPPLPPPPPPPADTIAPTVAITSPGPGATLGIRSVISIAANASDASGIASVVFLVDGKPIATDTGYPYSTNWNPRKSGAGAHLITARATDMFGNVAEQSITVTIAK